MQKKSDYSQKEFTIELRRRMKEKGYTISQLAEIMCISTRSLDRYLADGTDKVSTLLLFAKAFDCTLQELMFA